MAKTAAERKREQRERQRQATNIGRIDAVTHVRTANWVAMYADFNEITRGEALDLMVKKFWEEIPADERKNILRNWDARQQLEEKKKQKKDPTLSLFE